MNATPRYPGLRLLFVLLVPACLLAVANFPGAAFAGPAAVICPAGAPALGPSPDEATVNKYVTSHGLIHNANPKATIDAASIYINETTLAKLESTDSWLGARETVCDPSTPVWYVAFTAAGGQSFVFLGPPGKLASYPAGFEVFRKDTGNLIIVGGTATLRKI
jgi:hypothetical protein